MNTVQDGGLAALQPANPMERKTKQQTPGAPDYGQLKFAPAWVGLRSDARFVKIADGLQPNSARR